MQTFLPYQSFTRSLQCLDNKRLGKQRIEALQILNALESGSTSKWRNHPAVKMWKGYETALKVYYNEAIIQWVLRGFNNSMRLFYFGIPTMAVNFLTPSWLTESFCASHRSNLLRKDPVFYGKYGWTEPDNLPYIWPVR